MTSKRSIEKRIDALESETVELDDADLWRMAMFGEHPRTGEELDDEDPAPTVGSVLQCVRGQTDDHRGRRGRRHPRIATIG